MFPRWLLMLLGTLLIVSAVICARMLLGAHREIALAQIAAAHQNRLEQTRHLRRALAYHLPVNPFERQAADALLRLSEEMIKANELEQAFTVLQDLRAALLGLRHLGQPHQQILAQTNERLAILIPLLQSAKSTNTDALLSLSRLANPPRLSRLWVICALTGFFLWTAGGVIALFFVFTEELKLRLGPHQRRYRALLVFNILVGFLLFCLGMANA